MSRFVESNEAANRRLGAAIRRLRHAQGLTLVVLAERAGVSHPFLSQLERGRCGVSMKTLYQLAEALGTSPNALVSAALEAPAPDAGLVRAADQPVLFASRLLLASGDDVRVIELALEPADPGRWFRHEQDELVYVVAGGIETALRRGRRTTRHALAPRDALTIPGGVAHRHRATAPDGAICLLMQTAPRSPR